MRVPSVVVGIAFGALVAATSWGAGFAILALLPLAGWWVLRPLEAEERARVRARERRIAAARAAGTDVTPTRGAMRVGQR